MSKPLVEVVILTHNSLGNIKGCLESLTKCNYENLRISVVDQNSKDGTGDFIEKNYKNVNLIRNKINKSFSAGNNDVLRGSKAKYCLLLNDDTTHEPMFIDELVKVAERTGAVSVQPKVLDLKNPKMLEYAGAGGGFIDIYGYPVCRGRVFDSVENDNGQYDDTREIFWSCGVGMLIRMDVMRKIGYLDEDFGSYGEELDWCWRALISGNKVMYSGDAVIYHLGSGSWGKRKNSEKEYLIHRNHLIILFKNYEPKTLRKVIWTRILFENIAFARFLFSEPSRSLAILKSGMWILFNQSLLKKKNKEIKKLRKIPDRKIMDKMIRKSVVYHYFVKRDKKEFGDYAEYIKDY